jgi:hydroxylaminobenzene mutase
MQPPLDLRLARHGVIVLLLGLLTGFLIGKFHNHGAADAAHLVGLIGGFGLIALGLLWPRLALGLFWSRLAAWLMVATMYLSWVGVAVLGGLGSGPQAPSSPMFGSPALWDRVAGSLLFLAVWTSLPATLIVLFGLRKLSSRATEGAGAQLPVASS